MASKTTALRSALFLAVVAIAAHGSDDPRTCVYTVYVRTGNLDLAGTDSKISLSVGNADGAKFLVRNLVKWGGLMGKNYDYFERGNLDIFSGRGACLDGPMCSLELFSDGTGKYPEWYCDYVLVSYTGPYNSCVEENFIVGEWLATNSPPYQLSFSINICQNSNATNATIVM